MFDLSTFLMRWFFLCNLIRDVAEIQTLPYKPDRPHQANPLQPAWEEQAREVVSSPTPHNSAQTGPHTNGYTSQSNNARPIANENPSNQLPPQTFCTNPEDEWRGHCLRGILSYPPGTQRRLVMDAMRFELVHQLGQYFRDVDASMRRIRQSSTHQVDSQNHSTSRSNSDARSSDDIKLDADPHIGRESDVQRRSATETMGASANKTKDEPESALYFSDDVATGSESHEERYLRPTESEIRSNKLNMKQIRDCLPQLVSAVLKAPAPFDPNLVDPVHRLRELIIDRCQEDPSWGIELCWLLEAEVGRAWKSLFEHRQQTGKRLIIVMPADKAAVLAQIGPRKREAFDLLQDAERVTAYGYPSEDEMWHNDGPPQWKGRTPRLPSSISLLRCSHFGDTMQFVDRMTQISLDLRRVAAIDRHAYLEESLYEMNRRLRRRMITRGEVSLDVEDNLGPFEWPEMTDLTLDILKHSVHFPLVPNEGVWPAGSMEPEQDEASGGLVQVLNIVVPESRLLASRERCPYLVRLEVADTGLEGSDARLYASGAPRVGITVEEALCTRASSCATADSNELSYEHCKLPIELVPVTRDTEIKSPSLTLASDGNSSTAAGDFPRGGWQMEADETHYMHSSPYDAVRENEYEQLHQHMQDGQVHSAPPQCDIERPAVSTGEALLNRVFGPPWKEVCDEVRRNSPYGHLKGWRLASFILKAGEDIRREALVMQMISKFQDWFEAEIPEHNRPFLRPYTIMCVGGDAGLLECLTDAKSVDEVKKTTDGFTSLRGFFERAYGPPQSAWPGSGLPFEHAQYNFLRSLVGYSLVCYVLQIKDRHNANILLDREGHIAHIDFGFVLGDTPRMAKVPIFSERAPFKLSKEFWEVLGGWRGLGVQFCQMFEEAFACASTHSEELASLVEGIMLTLNDNPAGAKLSAQQVRSRLRMRGPAGSTAQKTFIRDLISEAVRSWGTSTYDWLQKNMNGYQ